jgi:poly-gamma-glutamate synthesis protein (capsule biosynthesis protein)
LFRTFAHAAVEDGADLIYGHSAHTFQGVELHRDGLILYDTGGFLDDYAVDPILRYDWSLLFLADIDAGRARSLRMIPVRLGYAQAQLATGLEFEAIADRMRRQCANLGTPVMSTRAGLTIDLSPDDRRLGEAKPTRQRSAIAAGTSVTSMSRARGDGLLTRVLAPVDAASFMANYWDRAALYIPGEPTKFAGLFNRSKFFASVSQSFNSSKSRLRRDGTVLNAGVQGTDGNHHQLPIQPEQIRPLLAAGFTIHAERLDAADPGLHSLARELKEQIDIPGPVDMAGFLSPDGSGYGLHYDFMPMWVIQIEGAKRWWYSSQPAVPFPQTSRVPTARERELGVDGLYDERDMREQLLRSGDVLYLPAGTWHRVRAEGESLHLCLSVRHCDYLQLVSELLAPALLSRADWRHAPMPLATPEGLEEMDSQLEALFTERLLELRAAVDALAPRDLFRGWRDRVRAV